MLGVSTCLGGGPPSSLSQEPEQFPVLSRAGVNHGSPRLGRIVTELRIAVRSRIANFHRFRVAVRGSLNLFELQKKCKKLTPIQKMSSSQSCSHQKSLQNAPIEKFTALTVTLFVKNHKFDPDPKQCRHHKVVRTKILCRMHRSANSQLSRRPFS